MSTPMTSMQRVLTTLGHQEPDRVPLFLMLTMHGARELGLSIEDYFSKAEYVVEGQLRMRAKYGHDCLYPFFYAPLEVEAWGAKVIFRPDGPPNSGLPVIRDPEQIDTLQPPVVAESGCLAKVLDAISLLKAEVGETVPIIGVALSPFSLPVMQMGFDNYLNLIFDDTERFEKLMQVNERFCVEWANAQLAAGATAICFFDPVSSPSMITPEQYRATGFRVAQRTLAQIQGPTATHFASGNSLKILGDVAQTGTAVVGVSADEDLAALKAASQGKVSLLGNLNGLTMRKWTPAEAEAKVRNAIRTAGPGGGFILADNHGEIPFQVPEETLMVIAESVRAYGTYPLRTAD